jgi:A/G-specific adenine glycosylase
MHFSQKLVRWYLQHRRPLPWREHRNPYAIWLSEIILQQTRVEQGIPYYLRFVERFPTLPDLAEADLDEVLQLWQGLGYYSRARNLHRAAQQMHREWGGTWKTQPEDWRKLPGIGPYTAGAVTSIAFGTRAVAVDGNVIRVLSRYFGYEEPVDCPSGTQALALFAESLLPNSDCGDHTQALMELGSLVCTPTKPDCAQCPVSGGCQVAFKTIAAEGLPVKQGKTHVRVEAWRRVLVRHNGKVVVYRRPDKGIWAGLFDLPAPEDAVRWGMEPDALVWQEPVVHLLSHRRLYLSFGHWESPAPPLVEAPFHWIGESDWEGQAWPAPLRRWLKKNTTFGTAK